jgi:hypothetical protein
MRMETLLRALDAGEARAPGKTPYTRPCASAQQQDSMSRAGTSRVPWDEPIVLCVENSHWGNKRATARHTHVGKASPVTQADRKAT